MKIDVPSRISFSTNTLRQADVFILNGKKARRVMQMHNENFMRIKSKKICLKLNTHSSCSYFLDGSWKGETPKSVTILEISFGNISRDEGTSSTAVNAAEFLPPWHVVILWKVQT